MICWSFCSQDCNVISKIVFLFFFANFVKLYDILYFSTRTLSKTQIFQSHLDSRPIFHVSIEYSKGSQSPFHFRNNIFVSKSRLSLWISCRFNRLCNKKKFMKDNFFLSIFSPCSTQASLILNYT